MQSTPLLQFRSLAVQSFPTSKAFLIKHWPGQPQSLPAGPRGAPHCMAVWQPGLFIFWQKQPWTAHGECCFVGREACFQPSRQPLHDVPLAKGGAPGASPSFWTAESASCAISSAQGPRPTTISTASKNARAGCPTSRVLKTMAVLRHGNVSWQFGSNCSCLSRACRGMAVSRRNMLQQVLQKDYISSLFQEKQDMQVKYEQGFAVSQLEVKHGSWNINLNVLVQSQICFNEPDEASCNATEKGDIEWDQNNLRSNHEWQCAQPCFSAINPMSGGAVKLQLLRYQATPVHFSAGPTSTRFTPLP